MKKTVGIYGFGRFGQLLATILKPDFKVVAFNTSDKSKEAKSIGVYYGTEKAVLKCSNIFLCVPISKMDEVTKKLKFKKGSTVIDVCSVKELPVRHMKKNIQQDINIIATHPMFGPDSAKKGIKGLRIVMHPERTSEDRYKFWYDYFNKKGFNVVELTPKQHDKIAAYSQGVTHFVGRILDELNLKHSSIDTEGFKKLLEVREQTTRDSWQLFCDLQAQNKFTRQMRMDVLRAVQKISAKLLPSKVNPKVLTVGIQGDEGSFSEQACKELMKKHKVKKFEIKYLITADKVATALAYGDIDRGVMAVQNSVGGMVIETIESLTKSTSVIENIHKMKAVHCLLARPEQSIKDVKIIRSHPQAIKQSKKTLDKDFKGVKLVSARDTALAAKRLSKGEYPKGTVVIASANAAKLYDLQILKKGLSGLKDNFTDFLYLKRR